MRISKKRINGQMSLTHSVTSSYTDEAIPTLPVISCNMYWEKELRYIRSQFSTLVSCILASFSGREDTKGHTVESCAYNCGAEPTP